MAGILDALGYEELVIPVFKTEKEEFKYVLENVDLFIINSCSVRQKSEDKVYGLGKPVKEVLMEKGRKPLIILAGCVTGSAKNERAQNNFSELRKKTEWADQYLSPSEIFRLPEFLGLKTLKIDPLQHTDGKHAFINISYGCDNYCSYCVVPYSRGKEVSRAKKEILGEINSLLHKNIEEITLCGQNVNSWGLSKKEKFKVRAGSDQKLPFAALLREIHKIKQIKKIDFISSNPFDFTNDLVEVLKLPKISNYVHIAVQSGNNAILKTMNRRHTVEQFIDLVTRIRTAKPGIEIGTDIIVGFPGETKKQFMDTVNLMKKVGFNVAFLAMYSPRKGTYAQRNLKDDVSRVEKKRRLSYITKIWKDYKTHE
jgi:tRNA-2-methylthio-N6-dimethylallyladenosine synthase